MTPFDTAAFAQHLLTDVLFYDGEYGVLSIISLVDPVTDEERYVCAFDPDDGIFAIEKGTTWDIDEPDEDVGFALASELEELGHYETPEEAAAVLFSLAQDEKLLPSISLHFEAEEA